MKQPKPVKAWMATLRGRLVDVVWLGKGAKPRRETMRQSLGTTTPNDRRPMWPKSSSPHRQKPARRKERSDDPDELIAETLRLDAEATKGRGPMRRGIEDQRRATVTVDHRRWRLRRNLFATAPENGPHSRDAEAITVYRTAAPRLARMLRAAIARLTVVRDRIGITDQQDASCADATLAEIERIAGGGWMG